MKFLYAFLLVCAVLGCTKTFASRAPHRMDFDPETFAHGDMPYYTHAPNLKDDIKMSYLSLARGGGGGGKDKGRMGDRYTYMLIKYIVPPSVDRDFLKAYMDLEGASSHHKGLEVQAMSKVNTTNVLFYQYEEWSRMKDLMDHLDSRHWDDFQKFVNDHDIKWTVIPLENESLDIEEETSQRHGKGVSKSAMESEKFAHVLFFFDVTPGEARSFIEEWHKAAKDTIKEEGNRNYLLRRSAVSNTHFYGCGSWETFDDYLDHFESDHMGRLRGYAADRDIVWVVLPTAMHTSKSRRDA